MEDPIPPEPPSGADEREDTLASTAPSREVSKDWKDLEGEAAGEPEEPHFRLPVDVLHRARRLEPWRFDRPHMRAFHFAWSSFFLAFFGWFAVPALLPTIKTSTSLGLDSKSKVYDSNAVALVGTVLMRFVIGSMADRYGPRISQATLLTVFSLPIYLLGTTFNYGSFVACRFFIGMVGATFVITEFWTSTMFSRNIVGTANAVAAGWGNAGGGVTLALMPQFFDLMKVFGLDDDKAWRVVMVIPATANIIMAVCLYLFADDCPDGPYKNLRREPNIQPVQPWEAFLRAASNPRTWVLFLIYASCFGVELTMDSTLTSYFHAVYKLGQDTAGVAAGLFGILNIFARALGGIGSDLMAHWFSMRGRVAWLFCLILLEGVFALVFSRMSTLSGALPVLIIFSIFTQMSCGGTFSIVPFVDPKVLGAVSGIVGGGGNAGGVFFSLVFSRVDYQPAMLIISLVVIGMSLVVLPLLWPLEVPPSTIGITEGEMSYIRRHSTQSVDAAGATELPRTDEIHVVPETGEATEGSVERAEVKGRTLAVTGEEKVE
ncbi:hypothetical protein CDCA_CDCA18G4603 [Cyanidium caldarium]|uniref:Major facilitator superfamily (MFS) profile domain-containing protein n=1 Tax=Cyanidium caldarium TaxID=2771 RepID=A0AAV9J3G5_CYACA|nr:hypothetical protein CDCA_CDCA18G4603 [Cyanidium caldarium]